MVKHFDRIKLEDVKGLSMWFWYKDGIATSTEMYKDLYTNTSSYRYYDWLLLAILSMLSPLIYLVMPFVTVWYAERNIIKNTEQRGSDYCSVLMYSKDAIEYFTVLENLRRNE